MLDGLGIIWGFSGEDMVYVGNHARDCKRLHWLLVACVELCRGSLKLQQPFKWNVGAADDAT